MILGFAKLAYVVQADVRWRMPPLTTSRIEPLGQAKVQSNIKKSSPKSLPIPWSKYDHIVYMMEG
jgi:hypothetical protein